MTRPTNDRAAQGGQLAGMAVAGLSVACAVPVILPMFDGGGRFALVLAALLPVAVVTLAAMVAARFRVAVRPAEVGAAIAVGVVLLAALPGGTLTGLGDGMARLLTTSLPASASGPAFGVVVAGTYLASAIAVGLVRSGRVALGCGLPGAVLMLGALLVGAGGPSQPTYAAALLVLTCAVGALLQQLGPAGWTVGPAGIRRVAVGLLVAATMAGLSLPFARILPGAKARQPYQLRAAVAPPPKPTQQIGLLETYSAVFDGPEQTTFTARVSGANPVSLYWQLATFDRFNGAEWSSSAIFQRAGTGLPSGPHLSAPIVTVRAVIAPTSVPGYLPAPGRAESVSVSGLGVATSDGELLIPAAVKLPAQLHLTAALTDPTSVQLVDARVPAGPVDAGAPPMPASLEEVASRLAASTPPYPFARLTALSDFLTSSPFVLHPPGDSPIGAGYYQVTQLLQTHDGSAEQYAAAFAVLARAMGFQTRLAIGYVGGTLDTATNTLTVTTRNLRVWPEVDLSGLGWVTLPADPARTGADQPAAAPLPAPLAQALQNQRQIDAAAAAAGPPNHATGPSRSQATLGRGTRVPWWGWAIVAVAAAAVALLGAVLIAKAARRRRQHGGRKAVERVSGAWEHIVDCLVEHGLSIPASLTTPEVADRAWTSFGEAAAGAVSVLSPVVDAARYDRLHPPDDEVADQAWASAMRVQSGLRAQASLRQRVRAALSIAPLTRRSR